MRYIFNLILIFSFLQIAQGQYPFDKYQTVQYGKKIGWQRYDKREKEGKFHWTISIPKFYHDQDSLTVQLTNFNDKDSSLIRIFKNKKQIQTLLEPYTIASAFGMLFDTIYFADLNGDSLLDAKIMYCYGGCGIASLNERVIYLIQKPDYKFLKISYLDKYPSSRLERDFDGDKNYEIITMNLEGFEGHNYWIFNLFNIANNDFINVNSKFEYPIMIQYLYKENYQITDKISKLKMKSFESKKPIDFDIRK